MRLQCLSAAPFAPSQSDCVNGSPGFSENAKRVAASCFGSSVSMGLERQVDARHDRLLARIDRDAHVALAVARAHVGAHDRREIAGRRGEVAHLLRRGGHEEVELVVADVVTLREARDVEMRLQELADRTRRVDVDVVLRMGGSAKQATREGRPRDAGRGGGALACRARSRHAPCVLAGSTAPPNMTSPSRSVTVSWKTLYLTTGRRRHSQTIVKECQGTGRAAARCSAGTGQRIRRAIDAGVPAMR